MGDVQTPTLAGLGSESAEGMRVGDDGDPIALGQGLVDDDLGDVEELVEVLDTDDTGLAEHRVEDFGTSVRVPHRVPRHLPGASEAGLDDDDGLGQGQVSGDPGELARIAHRLQVETDRRRGLVVDPVLHDVVA